MKKNITDFIKKNQYFFLPLVFFYAFAIYRIMMFSKIDNHLFFNRWVGNPYVDWFFKYLTHFGDGWFLIFIVFLLLFQNIRKALILLISYAIAGGLVSVLKNYVFDAARPHFVFDYYYKDVAVNYVEGVELLALNSFPSGHSTAAFVLVTFLMFQFDNRFIKFLFGLTGILIAFSRVYLSQHWINDIVAGSLIGMVLSSVILILFDKYNWLHQYNKGLIK